MKYIENVLILFLLVFSFVNVSAQSRKESLFYALNLIEKSSEEIDKKFGKPFEIEKEEFPEESKKI